ncbi:MAG TPA: hypothetical protein VGP26_14635 [Actinophytocola sp.]|jgi:hypothetical protein|nr:hypothetical protein [Actinophytocola sp.]
MSGRRSPEQVHEEDGHAEFVSSCRLCATEVEHDANAEQARAEVVEASLTFLAEPASTARRRPTQPRKRGECVEGGCTNKGTHRDGRCCGCHSRPGRTA